MCIISINNYLLGIQKVIYTKDILDESRFNLIYAFSINCMHILNNININWSICIISINNYLYLLGIQKVISTKHILDESKSLLVPQM